MRRMAGKRRCHWSWLLALTAWGVSTCGEGGDTGRDASLDARRFEGGADARDAAGAPLEAAVDGPVADATLDAPAPDAPDGASSDASGDAPGPPRCEPVELPALRAVDVTAERFVAPVYAVQAPGRPGDLFVVEQPGRIRIVRGAAVLEPPFLDIRDRVDFRGERGLLGLAFHPGFASNGRFFVYYTPRGEHRNVVAEYRVDAADPDRADPSEVRRLLQPRDPENNHNGGMLVFGPDGHLYVGMGDGGGRCDRHGSFGNALDLNSPFGKIHRLDVDAPERGFAASDNPFVGRDGLDTVWAYGLRNPWRFSFDREAGDLYVGDVGQDAWEEITVQPAATPAGRNYGWRDYEGPEPSSVSGCEPTGLVTEAEHLRPVISIRHGNTDAPVRDPCSVIGGYVYRGSRIPALRGYYLYGDFCSRDLAAFRYCEGRAIGHQRLRVSGTGRGLASFGEGRDGELYLVYARSGQVQRLEPAP